MNGLNKNNKLITKKKYVDETVLEVINNIPEPEISE
jgi:hypothetical protein